MRAPPHPRFVAVLAAAPIALVNTGCRPKDTPADLAWCPNHSAYSKGLGDACLLIALSPSPTPNSPLYSGR